MIGNSSIKKILFGGDYNPEQWDAENRKIEMELLLKAGVDIVTLNVFSWARIQPSEDEYDFSDLDSIVEMVSRRGMKICMATATAAHPAWMAKRHPDILRVDIDGRKHLFGARHNSCPTSPTYRKYAPRLAKKIAERYGANKNVVAWHISNEYGGLCYCENCAAAFRAWLSKKYGSLENLNRAWNTAFWGHTYYDWNEIQVSSNLSEEWGGCHTTCQIQTIDYHRFQSDMLLECFCLERDAIFEVTREIPVTTNMMGTYPELDYHIWAKEMDFVSWDNYPSPDAPYTRAAFNHEVMRGCKLEKPFCLMEQTPSVTNWQPYNSLKRPGVMRLWSYQALAHGSDTVMFFQMRRSRGCCEKLHGAIIDHYPSSETRVFKEASALGAELNKIGGAFLGSLQKNKVAVIFDWNSQWGVTYSAGPSVDFKYADEVFKYYDALARMNIGVDVIAPEESLASYDIVFAPALYMVSDDFAARAEKFVAEGGIFLVTTMSGLADENDLITTEGYPGKLRRLCGIWAEETDALLPNQKNSFVIKDGALKGECEATILCDIVHAEGAQVVATYGSDFYAGTPCVTKNKFGKGEAWYVASCFGERSPLLQKIVLHLAQQKGIEQIAAPVEGVEITKRVRLDGTQFVFALNHSALQKEIALVFNGIDIISQKEIHAGENLLLEANGVAIIKMNSNL